MNSRHCSRLTYFIYLITFQLSFKPFLVTNLNTNVYVLCLLYNSTFNILLYILLYIYIFLLYLLYVKCTRNDCIRFNEYYRNKLILIFLILYAFVFFHTILTVAQNTRMAYYTILPECYSIYLVIFTICASPEGCFVHPKGGNTHLVHPKGYTPIIL